MQMDFLLKMVPLSPLVCMISDFIQDGDAGSHFTVNRLHQISVFCSGSRESPQYWSQFAPIPENVRNRPVCHYVMCHKFI